MEEHRDVPLQCADCGAGFVFSGAEAAVFSARGLIAPKRCKECRRARKERGAQRAGQPDGRPRPVSRAPRAFAGKHPGGGRPRYTGDVNEYRSPMQSAASGHAGTSPEARPRHAADRPARTGDYRSPMQDRASHGARAERAPGAARLPKARKGAEAAKFPITCDACGAQAEVPFKPADGREVYCPTCYRARRAPAAPVT